MKEIQLNKGRVALVSEEDYDALNVYKWHLSSDGYARMAICANGRTDHVKMHRVITGAKKGQMVDHINGNKLDNRRENLRFCTQAQNQMNRKTKRKNATSKYKGVYLWKKKGQKSKWHATIKADDKTISLKYWDTEEDAAKAYNEAAVKYFGEFASLNDIPKFKG